MDVQRQHLALHKLQDLLSALLEQKADFALIGAYAMATYGIVRATMDIDLWIRATPQNARRVYRALAAFGTKRCLSRNDGFSHSNG